MGGLDGLRGEKEGKEMGSEGVECSFGSPCLSLTVSVLRTPLLLCVAFRNVKKAGRHEKHV